MTFRRRVLLGCLLLPMLAAGYIASPFVSMWNLREAITHNDAVAIDVHETIVRHHECVASDSLIVLSRFPRLVRSTRHSAAQAPSRRICQTLIAADQPFTVVEDELARNLVLDLQSCSRSREVDYV